MVGPEAVFVVLTVMEPVIAVGLVEVVNGGFNKFWTRSIVPEKLNVIVAAIAGAAAMLKLKSRPAATPKVRVNRVNTFMKNSFL